MARSDLLDSPGAEMRRWATINPLFLPYSVHVYSIVLVYSYEHKYTIASRVTIIPFYSNVSDCNNSPIILSQ